MRARLEAFAAEMFASLARADQRVKGVTYLRGLLLDGVRKSMQPMGQRLVPQPRRGVPRSSAARESERRGAPRCPARLAGSARSAGRSAPGPARRPVGRTPTCRSPRATPAERDPGRSRSATVPRSRPATSPGAAAQRPEHASPVPRSTLCALGRARDLPAARSASCARYASEPPCRRTSRDTIEGFRPIRAAISLSSSPSAKPREISSRSSIVSIRRTAGHPLPPNTKIRCYDRLRPRGPGQPRARHPGVGRLVEPPPPTPGPRLRPAR